MSNLTQRDNSQIERHEHDEAIDAKRVYIVGGADIKVNADTSQIAHSVASAVKEGLADLVPVMKLEDSHKPEIVVIKEPQIVEVEKQIVVTQKEIVYVDKPVIMEKIVYKEIEKPILIKEGIQSEKITNTNPTLVALVVLQTLITLGIIAMKI